MGKTLIRIAVNTAIGAVLIFIWLRLVNIREIIETLKAFNFWLLIPGIVLMILATVLKAIRFKVLLTKVVDIPSSKMISLTFVSQIASFTIPVRAGEITKSVYLSTQHNLHFGKSLVWVFLDRFLDFWAVLGLSLVLLLIISTNFPQSLVVALFWGMIVSSVLVVLIVLKPEYFKHLVKFISALLVIKFLKEKFLQLSFFVIDCFSLLKGSKTRNLKLFILTVLATVFEGVCWYLIFLSFIPGVSFLKIWLGSMLNALTFIIPAAPGYVGSAEAAGLAVFSYGLGLSQSVVPASTLIFHAISLIFIISTGIYGLYTLKFDLRLVWKKLFKK